MAEEIKREKEREIAREGENDIGAEKIEREREIMTKKIKR